MTTATASWCRRMWRTLAATVLAAAVGAQDDSFQTTGLFSLPRSQDDIFEWRKARDEIQQGKYSEAVERLHALLVGRRQGVIPVLDGVDRYLGERAAVIQTLRDLPPDGLAAYERLAAREAGGLVHSAFAGNKPNELEALADAFPTSTAGRKARLRLAALALERGDAASVVRHALAARDATNASDPSYARILAYLQLGRGLTEGQRLALDLPEPIRALVAAAEVSLPDAAATQHWNDHYGFARRPFSPPKGRIRLRNQLAIEPYGFDANEYAIHVVGGAYGLYVSDGERVVALDPFSRVPLWEAESAFLREAENRGEYGGQLNPNTVLAPAVSDDVVVASLLVPSEGENARVRAFDVMLKIPVRRLAAFDRLTGKQLWSHYDTKGGPITRRFDRHLACGPPLIDGDTVYVSSHDQAGSIAFYLAAYDLKTGEPRWHRLICSSQLEVNMFGNARLEFAASPLAIEGGVIYGTTNLGVCFAANQADGSLRWVSAYEVTRMPPTRLTHQEERAVYFANNPVLLADGVVACTPLDSEYILGLDADTGRVLWRQHYLARFGDENNHLQWLLGAIDDEFIVSGVGVLAIKAHSSRASLQPTVRLVRSRESLGIDPILDRPPRGAVVDGKIWYSRGAGVTVFDSRGTTDPTASSLLRSELTGNLVVTDGMVISAHRRGVDVFYDLELLVQQAERDYRERPDDPLAALEFAHLLRAQAGDNVEGPTAERSAEALRRGLAACAKLGIGSGSAVYSQLANQLFDLSLLRADSIAKRDGERALAQLRQARDGAPNDERWLEAQRRILALVRGSAAQIAELAKVEDRLGDRVARFDGGRELPAAAYVRWQIAERETTAERSLAAWQTLLERWPDVAIDGGAAREVAVARIDRLLARHGRGVYAAIEERAALALASASGDARALADIIERFPHSDAANGAVRSLMDLALAQGDLEAAVRCFRYGSARASIAASLHRRLLEAARGRGNPPLAAALRDRLAASFGDVPSDLPKDGGAAYRDLPPVTLVPPTPPPPLAAPPTHRLAMLQALVPGNRLQWVGAEVVPGFSPPPFVPFFVWEGGTVLRAHALQGEAAEIEAPLFTVDCPRLNPGTPLLVCGDRVVVVEQDRVRALRLRDGVQEWSRPAGDDRAFESLGVHAGLVQLFSEHAGASDGGRVVGLEPTTGAVMFERVFDSREASLSPTAAGGRLWSLRPEPDDPKRVWLEEMDPLTGQALNRCLLSDRVRALLQLPDGFTVQGALMRILSHLFVVDDLVVLAADGVSESPDRPPTLVALQRDGGVGWHWRGTPRRALGYLWHHDDTIAVYEAGAHSGGQVALLDGKTGRPVGNLGGLGGSLVALATPRPLHRDMEAPPLLVLANFNGSDWSVLCRAFGAERKPSFRASLAADGDIANPVGEPILGRDFLLVAVGVIGQNESYLHTFDLQRGTEAQRRRLAGVQVNRMTSQDGVVALETGDGITILGQRGTPLR
ncbi:MAG: PQQ-binding-like beta-propeller repeat protein [Planctomycetota bacterium]